MGADFIIVDDPIKPEDARPDAIRQKGNSWIRTTLVSRANGKRQSKLIMIQQRVHVDDPSGIFLSMKGTDTSACPPWPTAIVSSTLEAHDSITGKLANRCSLSESRWRSCKVNGIA